MVPNKYKTIKSKYFECLFVDAKDNISSKEGRILALVLFWPRGSDNNGFVYQISHHTCVTSCIKVSMECDGQ